jgi:predicted flap endonuclease-1-like 5' DNA nuclease
MSEQQRQAIERTAHKPDMPLHTLYGIGEQRAKKLQESGYKSVYDIAVAPVEKLEEVDLGNISAKDIKTDAKVSVGYFDE